MLAGCICMEEEIIKKPADVVEAQNYCLILIYFVTNDVLNATEITMLFFFW